MFKHSRFYLWRAFLGLLLLVQTPYLYRALRRASSTCRGRGGAVKTVTMLRLRIVKSIYRHLVNYIQWKVCLKIQKAFFKQIV